MNEPTKAVFLSYSSDDAEEARRICDTLRTAGIEVWFDQAGGLEHGDAWDAKIRRQIKECVFFLPVISARTQARLEGYFRIEWELAAERAMGFAHNVPFILPIVIDGTGETEALVPERFRKLQWTRVPGGGVTPEVQARFLRLWADRLGGQEAQIARAANFDSAPGLSFAAPLPPPTEFDEKSIAVLPFMNMSADAENEYFSDGMTEEIINALVQIPGLRVAARTSVFAFKGKPEDMRTVARKLNVRSVLEGSVRKAGNRIRITAQLVNAEDGFHHWSERFDRDLHDVFAVQEEIARMITDKLKVKLPGGGRGPLVIPPTANLEAYQLYLEGRYFWSLRGAGLVKGLKCFLAAIARDPQYALAHAGVADVYNLLAFYGVQRPNEVMPKARAAAERALALDPNLAEAHGALAFIWLHYDWNVAAAKRGFARAIELKPTYVPARNWNTGISIVLNRPDDLVASDLEAVRIEPLSVFAHTHVGWMMLLAERAAEAVPHLEHALDLEPRFVLAHRLLGETYLALGRIEEGLAKLQSAVTLSGNLPWMVATQGCALAHLGRKDEARAMLADLTRRSATEYVRAFLFAMLHAYLGEEDRAIECLEQARQERDLILVYLVGFSGSSIGDTIPPRYLNAEKRAAFIARLGLVLD